MSVLYKARRSSIANAKGKKQYFAQLVSSGCITTDEIAASIELKSSLTQGDVLSVMRNLVQEMRDAFKDGKSVKIDGLGSFHLVAKCGGNGVDSKDEVSAAQIKRAQIHFREESSRVGGQTRTNLSNEIHFIHADTLLETLAKDGVKDGTGDAGDGGDSGDTGGDGDHSGDLLGG